MCSLHLHSLPHDHQIQVGAPKVTGSSLQRQQGSPRQPVHPHPRPSSGGVPAPRSPGLAGPTSAWSGEGSAATPLQQGPAGPVGASPQQMCLELGQLVGAASQPGSSPGAAPRAPLPRAAPFNDWPTSDGTVQSPPLSSGQPPGSAAQPTSPARGVDPVGRPQPVSGSAPRGPPSRCLSSPCSLGVACTAGDHAPALESRARGGSTGGQPLSPGHHVRGRNCSLGSLLPTPLQVPQPPSPP